MLSYQHAYHAGGPADVHKHILLLALVRQLAQKAKPFCALDVFAGEGVYDLTEPMAAKTGEHRQGIGALWDTRHAPPPVATYVDLVRTFNSDGRLRIYPGSPAILAADVRADDHLIVNELHPTANAALHRWARRHAAAVHRRDGLEALVALVPPTLRRGIAVIDPSYEVTSDYAETGTAVARAAAKWSTGIFAVWYPLLADDRHVPLLTAINTAITLPTMTSELLFDTRGLADAPQLGLRGSGVLIVNPPWQFENVANESGAWLAKALPLGPKANHVLRWIYPRT